MMIERWAFGIPNAHHSIIMRHGVPNKLERSYVMHDVRIERWAHTLVHYCLYLKPGDILAIHATPLATPLIEAVYREALHVGAQPVPVIDLESLNEILLREGNEQQLQTLSPIATTMAEKANARL